MARINTEDLIDARAVADLLGLAHRNTVSVYQTRYPDMPRPVVERARGRIKLWLQPEIERWKTSHSAARRAQGGQSHGS